MAIYELTLRFDADDDNQALALGVDVEGEVTGSGLPVPSVIWRKYGTTVERLTRVVVTHMPLTAEQVRLAGEPC